MFNRDKEPEQPDPAAGRVESLLLPELAAEILTTVFAGVGRDLLVHSQVVAALLPAGSTPAADWAVREALAALDHGGLLVMVPGFFPTKMISSSHTLDSCVYGISRAGLDALQRNAVAAEVAARIA